jgi:hypothetical protein
LAFRFKSIPILLPITLFEAEMHVEVDHLLYFLSTANKTGLDVGMFEQVGKTFSGLIFEDIGNDRGHTASFELLQRRNPLTFATACR